MLIKELRYKKIVETGEMIKMAKKVGAKILIDAAQASGIAVQVGRVGSVFGMFFNDKPINNMKDAKSCDLDRFTKYYNAMLEQGIYIAPSQFESGFVSIAHSEEQIKKTIQAVKTVFDELAGQ